MSIYLNQLPGRTLIHMGKEYLYFGGTSYLGLNTDTAFQALFIENLKKNGLNHGASRNSNIRLGIFDQAERALAQRSGSQAAAVLSSGYLAAQLLRRFFEREDFAVFHHVSAHSSLKMNSDRVYDTVEDLKMSINAVFALSEKKTPVLFFDSISFNKDNFPDFAWLKKLPLEKMILVADDSHGIGIIGEGGSGVYNTLTAFHPKELICCASLNKAPAVQAGVIWGSEKRIEMIKNTAVFAGSSPPAPAGLATFINAEKLYSQRLERLQKNYFLFLDQLDRPYYFDHCPGHPAFSYPDKSLTKALEKEHILITHFKYAGASTPDLNRIVLSAQHTEQDISRLTGVINRFQKLG